MLDYILLKTLEFLEEMPKSKRKKKGQFFTSKETAEYMAGLFNTNNIPDNIRILDPGAGTGILATALTERIQKKENIKKISLVCYETDVEVLSVLKENLEYVKQHCLTDFEYQIKEEDYLLSQSEDFEKNETSKEKQTKYDFIIGNPPYLKILKNDPAALAMPTVVHGAPNLYFLFAAMSLFNLKNDSEMVYIIPRSWTSGAYFKAFRKYLLNNGKIEHIHLFASRDKVFSQEQVLQETIIVKIKKTMKTPENVTLTSSQSNGDFNNLSSITLPYESIVAGDDLYVFLPTNENELNTVTKINQYSDTLPDLGFKMRTGIVVDFRQFDDLRKNETADTCPLFYSQHIKNGKVNHIPSSKNYEWLTTKKSSLVQKNKNYVFCKRFTAKEEKRRLQCGIYLKEDFSQYSVIGTQNKINFIDSTSGNEMSKQEVYGLYALFNSTLFDQYYRILNGSTQVNSTEINSIPVPPINTIRDIGQHLMDTKELSTETCDRILEEVAYGQTE